MKNLLSIMLLAIMVCCWSCSGGEEEIPTPTPTPNPTPENNQTNTSDSEREALIDFYKATNGDNWKNNENWCSDKPLKEWYGIKTSNSGLVQTIDLRDNQLSGIIPESIGKLKSLKQLYLHVNQLSGSIPESIGNLENLNELCLGSNQLSGNIPDTIGNLKNLTNLHLDSNQLSGKIPESIGNLNKLELLYLYGNQLSGDLPESIGNLTQLMYLHIGDNQFSGSIPKSIGNLNKLEQLCLSNNQFSGNIPETIGNLINLGGWLEFSDNQFSGSIPESIGNLSKVVCLQLFNNQLSGDIPESLGNMSKLEYLYLFNNQLSGSIPESIGNLTQLFDLNLSNNQLSGSIPESIGNLSRVEILNLSDNQLSSSIPESFGNLASVQSLNLGNNQLSGRIPESFINSEIWSTHWTTIITQKGEGFSKEGLVIPAPKFKLYTIDGRTLDDGVYAENEYTILYHYYDWCSYSSRFTPQLVNIYKTYKSKGIEVIAFSDEASTASYHSDYAQKFNTQWPYIMMTPNSQKLFMPYAWGSPCVNVVDKNGHVVFNHIQNGYNDLETFLVEKLGESDESLYTSTDYSRDGEVVTLQKATQGQGITLTFMGEAFVDKDMETGGLYEQKMKEGMEKFFSMEPYKSLRNRFNVYAVKVVSPNAEWIETAEHRINQNNGICFAYAQRIPDANKNPLMVSVIYNTTHWTDRSYTNMYTDGSFVGYMMEEINNVLIHESGGHGFANLLDEYVEDGLENSTLSQDEATLLDNMWSTYSWGANVDWRSDATTVKWSHFLKDSRYANEGLGLYEGAYLYGHGAYRPTENSMMRYGDSPFNAPSREQIYKRVMQLSEGENWKYDYEEFVKFDVKNRNAASRSAIKPLTKAEQQEYIKNHRPPTIIKGTWRDAMKGKGKVVVPLR